MVHGDRAARRMISDHGSRGGGVLIGAPAVDSLGNGLFLPLSLVYFVQLTEVPLALVGVLLSVANAVTPPIPVWAGTLAGVAGRRVPGLRLGSGARGHPRLGVAGRDRGAVLLVVGVHRHRRPRGRRP
ncbi:hypothetical protein [Pseudonocardia kunmingensis]|uniref:hypothetical protein n=1 Tax=Pseudonocardia kunmingensis TaxID=630975 RepID=UPI001B873713|nr:hypothetical protein [Pseudonocardia kunmingensis]